MKKRKKRIEVSSIICCVFLAIYSAIMIALFYWAFINSLKTKWDFRTNNLFGAPKEWMWSNYKTVKDMFSVNIKDGDAFRDVYTMEMLKNTLLYGVGSAFVSTLVPCLVSYLVAKFNFKFLKAYYIIVIVTMVLPIIGLTSSELDLAIKLGLYDNIFGVWIMKAHFLSPYFLVFYASFKQIPDSFKEAAEIDGASNWTILFKIMLPQVAGMFFTIMLLFFIGYWNDYSVALIYLPNHPTLAVGLWRFSNASDKVLASVPMQLSGCMYLFVPILIIFLIFHNKFMGNISIGGLKE